jgi:hypothetical protein
MMHFTIALGKSHYDVDAKSEAAVSHEEEAVLFDS